jgi:uncharacterized protein
MGIPHSIQAARAVSHQERYAGRLAIKSLKRLAEVLTDSAGELEVEWRAERDAFGHPLLDGRLKGRLALQCQSCLKNYTWPLELEVRLRLVSSEAEERKLLGDCDPYLVQDDELPLREITEDEVLLALPLMPRCETCENAAQSQPSNHPSDEPARPNPFAALKKLKS